ncbi:MAG TPA: tRNA (adenosine(37)-N6)-dimethylallyltransferase MiaA [Saprospiraceae bacterium]|nr:tRNA (adenosine(37)-N6)-dimethylallyltransferase MiaA [Saprospiraceae bacterium]
MPNKLLVIIGGATAVGKTPFAIRLARHYETDIVNADSRQVYKELNIGVGKPSAEELALVPHHLIGHVSISTHYSAGQYTHDALAILEILFQKNDIVILAGGTGLYIKAIMEGFDQMPDVPQEVNEYWTNTWKEKGVNELLILLEKHDPEYFKIVDRANPLRLIRAVSFIMHTGKPFSSFHTGQSIERPFQVLPIALELPRNELYTRINLRVHDMIAAGWMEEAIVLYPHKHLKALQTVGYKELFEVIEGNITLEQAIPLIQQSTRRYAKRQMTWFRNQGEWVHVGASEFDVILDLINNAKQSIQ